MDRPQRRAIPKISQTALPYDIDRLLFEARIAGVGLFEALDYTWGELVEMIKVYNERERRKHQQEANIAFRQAELISMWVWKNDGDINVSDIFPYWNEEEKRQAELEKYKAIMYRHVDKSKK